jgi:hypothetical protein
MKTGFRQALSEYLHPKFGLTAVVVLFVVVDTGLAIDQRPPWVAAAIIAAAGFCTLRYAGAESHRGRLLWLAGLIGVLILLPELGKIAAQGPNAIVHDGIMFTDAAADRLVHGLDPYGHDYVDSAQVRRAYVFEAPVNWGLGHYVYPPGMILLDVPLRLLRSPLVNMTWLWPPALVGLCLAAYHLGRNDFERTASVVAVVLNPGFLIFFSQHYNELIMLIPALAAIGYARRGRAVTAGILLGLALCLKQSAVIFFPLTLFLIYRVGGWSALARQGMATALTAAAVLVPFVVWAPGAFIQDAAGFFFGSGTYSDPIRGYGLTGILYHLGVIPNQWSPFPSGVIELTFLLPITAAALLHLYRSFRWSAFWLWMAAEALAVFFFGRLMAPNYFQLVVTFISLGLLVRLPHDAKARRGALIRPLSRRAGTRAVLGGVLAVALMVGLVTQVAEWLQPNPSGYRVALAPGTEGGVYLADSVHGFVALDPVGRVRARTSLLKSVYPLSLSFDGRYGLMGTGSGLWLTDDQGTQWRRISRFPIEAVYGKYFAVSVRGQDFLAGAWGAGLWYSRDAGQSWRQASVPTGDLEFEAILSADGEDLAATELGILRSTDGGATWSRATGVPNRMTALSRKGSSYWAGDWRGGVFLSHDGGSSWSRQYALPGGVWSMGSGTDVVGTSGGLYARGALSTAPGLDRREIVAVVSSQGNLYAARAKGELYVSGDGGVWRAIFTPTS